MTIQEPGCHDPDPGSGLTAPSAEDKPRMPSRRTFMLSVAASFGLGAAAGAGGLSILTRKEDPLGRATADATPATGYRTRITFGDSVRRLVSAGAIDREKFDALYRARGGVPAWVSQALDGESAGPVLINTGTAPYLLTLFWPMGLATKTAFNEDSPLKRSRLDRFASTGGWVLGQEKNGAAYFNGVETMALGQAQEETVLAVAKAVFRPCCDNSTFFQDCNHGSAVLGLLELAASQGASAEELYEIALAASAHWFPSQFRLTALYLNEIDGRSWGGVAPSVILGAALSSASGWKRNVYHPVATAGLLPRFGGGGNGCSL